MRPQSGTQMILSSIFSPITNSKDGFIKNTFTARKFYSFKQNIISIQAKAANITSLQDDEISDSDKYALGGKWLRGFDVYGAGPRNSSTSYIGGNNLLVSKIDISRSLFKKSNNPIDFFVFTDIGKVYGNKISPTNSEESIRASVGYGIKLYSPIGPIGLTWGSPILDESYDIKREFLFTIGNLN
jgi:outer membrane protein insertion porin family